MAKGTGINKKFQPTGVLADIVGKTPISWSQLTVKIGKYMTKHELRGEKGDGYSVKFKGKNATKAKTYTGGQIIHCGEDPAFKKLCGGKQRVAFVEVAKYSKKYMKAI
jgi:hypothetical protein